VEWKGDPKVAAERNIVEGVIDGTWLILRSALSDETNPIEEFGPFCGDRRDGVGMAIDDNVVSRTLDDRIARVKFLCTTATTVHLKESVVAKFS
jgi:hypothetical protein